MDKITKYIISSLILIVSGWLVTSYITSEVDPFKWELWYRTTNGIAIMIWILYILLDEVLKEES